jgi:hypothetical protein
MRRRTTVPLESAKMDSLDALRTDVFQPVWSAMEKTIGKKISN